MELKTSTKVSVKMTEKKGWGCFATDKIAEGEVIEECHLLTLPLSPGEPSSLFIDYRFNWPQGSDWVEQVLPLGNGCIYNHSDNNNATWRNHPEYKAFQFVAVKDINPGEEICTYYGDGSYWGDGRDNIEVV